MCSSLGPTSLGLRASWTSWKSISFARLGKFSFIICSNKFSISCCYSSSSGTPIIHILECFQLLLGLFLLAIFTQIILLFHIQSLRFNTKSNFYSRRWPGRIEDLKLHHFSMDFSPDFFGCYQLYSHQIKTHQALFHLYFKILQRPWFKYTTVMTI